MSEYLDACQQYEKALNHVVDMTSEQRLETIDLLYGRSNLSRNYTDEELMAECLNQVRREWTPILLAVLEKVSHNPQVSTATQG
jgi:hypothetical protein